jgi:hypothetical protein
MTKGYEPTNEELEYIAAVRREIAGVFGGDLFPEHRISALDILEVMRTGLSPRLAAHALMGAK